MWGPKLTVLAVNVCSWQQPQAGFLGTNTLKPNACSRVSQSDGHPMTSDDDLSSLLEPELEPELELELEPVPVCDVLEILGAIS